MQFNSFVYILLFLPLITISYYAANRINIHLGKFVILVSSVIFYCYTDISVLMVLGIGLVANFTFSLLIAKVKKWRPVYLIIPILVNVGLLLYYKYLNFAISNLNIILKKEIPITELILPIGISFFTFQQIAYIVAIHKGELVTNSLLDYLEAVCSIAVKEFEDLFQNYPIEQWKFECLDHMGVSMLPDFIKGNC